MFARYLAAALVSAVTLATSTPAHAAERIGFAAFVERLQRDTCTALYGDTLAGPGAVCLEQDVLAAYRTDPEDHVADVALCDAEGGVLADRIPACTEAMVHYLCASAQYDGESNLAPLLESYAAVSSRCWGQWLCVE